MLWLSSGSQAATRARGEDASILRSRQRGSALIKVQVSPLASAMPEHYVAAAHLVELMAMSAHGDHAAFAELYDLTSRRIHGVVLGVLRSPEHAEEVTKQVYVEVWQQSARNHAKGSVFAWTPPWPTAGPWTGCDRYPAK